MTAMRGRRGLWVVFLLLLAAAAAAIVIVAGQARQIGEFGARAAKLESEKKELGGRVEQLARENDALRKELGMPPRVERGRVAAPPPAREPAGNVEQVRLLVRLQDELAGANRNVADLQARVRELEASLEKVNQENQRLAAAEVELREKLAGRSRALETAQDELKARSDRLAQVENTNAVLHQENRDLVEKTSGVGQALRELAEINRRREAYLSSILRRYRDLTDQFRTVAIRAEGAAESSEVARIQSAVAATEEDLRQLASLNAQAARAQQRIAGR